MKVKARKVGNSLTITLPKEVVMEMDIAEDTDMNVFVREGAVVVEPVTSRWERLVGRVRADAAARGLSESDVQAAMAEIRPREGGSARGGAPDAD